MFELGSTLREARVRRGIELAQVAAETRIRTRYLQALEDERFELLPGSAYAKGFLRAYADYLGLDGQLFVDEYSARFNPNGLRRHLTSSSCDRSPCGATAWGPTPARGERAANFAPKDDDHEHGLGVRDDERSEHGQQFGQHHDDRGALMGNRDDSGLVGGHDAGPGK